jgi:hypothetical protein
LAISSLTNVNFIFILAQQLLPPALALKRRQPPLRLLLLVARWAALLPLLGPQPASQQRQ